MMELREWRGFYGIEGFFRVASARECRARLPSDEERKGISLTFRLRIGVGRSIWIEAGVFEARFDGRNSILHLQPFLRGWPDTWQVTKHGAIAVASLKAIALTCPFVRCDVGDVEECGDGLEVSEEKVDADLVRVLQESSGALIHAEALLPRLFWL